MKQFFESKGINIDDFTVTVNHEITHLRGIHGRGNMGQFPGHWNAKWQEFIDAKFDADAKDIYQFTGRLMDEFGISHLPIHPYGE